MLSFGTLVFTGLFLVVTAKICIDTTYWTGLMHFAVWVCSLGSFAFFIFVYTEVCVPLSLRAYSHVHSYPHPHTFTHTRAHTHTRTHTLTEVIISNARNPHQVPDAFGEDYTTPGVYGVGVYMFTHAPTVIAVLSIVALCTIIDITINLVWNVR